MTESLHVFVDSNILLHYPPLDQVDWCKLCGSKSVTLVICLPVIHELDKKKSDPRLADRADRAIKEIRKHAAATTPLRDNVTLSVFNHEIRLEEFPATLSPDSMDDRIVHLTKKYLAMNDRQSVAIVSEDYGMELRCLANSVPTISMNTDCRLSNPQDELEKKYKQAVTELNAAKNRLPSFVLRVSLVGGDVSAGSPFRCDLSNSWKSLDVPKELEKTRRLNPKHGVAKNDVFAIASNMLNSFITEDDWKRYNNKLDGFYTTYEAYLHRLNTWGSNNARTLWFDLWLENDGSCPAEDVDVLLLIPPKLKWVALQGSDEAKALSRPSPPEPPEKPKPTLASLHTFDHLRFSATGPLANQIERIAADRDRDVVEVFNEGERGFCIHARLERLKHGQLRKLGTFAAVFGSWADVSPFEAELTITTSELPSKVTGKAPFIVRIAESSLQ